MAEMTGELGRPIVAGMDGSDSAREAALWAAEEAERRNVPLRLVTAVHLPVYAHPGDAARVRQAVPDERARHRAWIRQHGEDLPEVRGWTWSG